MPGSPRPLEGEVGEVQREPKRKAVSTLHVEAVHALVQQVHGLTKLKTQKDRKRKRKRKRKRTRTRTRTRGKRRENKEQGSNAWLFFLSRRERYTSNFQQGFSPSSSNHGTGRFGGCSLLTLLPLQLLPLSLPADHGWDLFWLRLEEFDDDSADVHTRNNRRREMKQVTKQGLNKEDGGRKRAKTRAGVEERKGKEEETKERKGKQTKEREGKDQGSENEKKQQRRGRKEEKEKITPSNRNKRKMKETRERCQSRCSPCMQSPTSMREMSVGCG